MSTRTSGQPGRVFISHATHDRDFVESEIVSLLESHGIETWFSIDSIRGSEDWQKRIRAGLGSRGIERIQHVTDLVLHYVDLLSLLRLAHVHLVGSSLGGWIACELATLSRMRRAM
jgi:pimeloyl-ACP methyl ester carboxylesterase